MHSKWRYRVMGIGASGLLGFGVSGCGLSGNLAVPFEGPSTHQGTVQSLASAVSGSTTPSSNVFPTTSSETKSMSASPGSTVKTSNTGGGTSSSYPAVVNQALQWLHARTSRALGAPTWIPGAAKVKGQYLSPTTNVSQQGWAIFLHLTSRPYGVNNPAINQSPHTRNWVSWGLNVMTPSQLDTHQLGLLEAYNPIGPNHPPVTTGTSHSISLGTGITGKLYENGTVIWHEGNWTLMVQGTDANRGPDVAQAKTLEAYLHTASLPPHPGLIDVYQNTASVDWLNGRFLFSIMGGREPAPDVLHMAVSWRPLS